MTATAHPKALSLRMYRTLTRTAEPVFNSILSRRLKAGKEDPERIGERRGVTDAARPAGKLLWIHGASVGESLSVLPLIARLSALYPQASFLVTTGTVTSADLMAKRLPPRAIHQFAPLDQPGFVTRFLDHWQPDAALFVESELWPGMISEAQGRGFPMGLVNGRLSPKSFKSWSRRPKAARELLDAFHVLLGQDPDNAARLSTLAGREAAMVGNLKRAAPPLPTDELSLNRLREATGDRPVWLAASTHVGEEERILDAHRQVAERIEGLVTVLVPRHPKRGDEVAALITAQGQPFRRRSHGQLPSPDAHIYLADTLGELGIFYRLSDVAFIGGSLVPIGGHNPMEPARLGSAIVTGPHVFNFSETFQSMRQAGALALVRNERDLAASLLRLLTDARTREEMSDRALRWSDQGAEQVLDDIVGTLSPILGALDEAGTC